MFSNTAKFLTGNQSHTSNSPASLNHTMGIYDGIRVGYNHTRYMNSDRNKGQRCLCNCCENKSCNCPCKTGNCNCTRGRCSCSCGYYSLLNVNNSLYGGMYTVPQGHGVPLAHEKVYHQTNPNTLGLHRKNGMFMFVANKASPYCRSSLSTSTGQLCTTSAQSKFIAEHRGGNKYWYDDSF